MTQKATTITKAAIVLAWIGGMVWLIGFEAYPEIFTNQLKGYQSLLDSDVLVEDVWMTVEYKGEPIGYLHHAFERKDENPAESYLFRNNARVALDINNEKRSVLLTSETYLNEMQELTSFRFSASAASAGHLFQLNGKRTKENEIEARAKIFNNKRAYRFDLPKNAVLYVPLSGRRFLSIGEGEERVLSVFNPLTQQKQNVLLKGQGKEVLTIDDKDYKAHVIQFEYLQTVFRVWLDENGSPIKQALPTWDIVSTLSTDEKALNAYDNARGLPVLQLTKGLPFMNMLRLFQQSRRKRVPTE
jgi:hypothetical protein